MSEFVVFQESRGEPIYVVPANACRFRLDKSLNWNVTTEIDRFVTLVVSEALGGSLRVFNSMRESIDYAAKLAERK